MKHLQILILLIIIVVFSNCEMHHHPIPKNILTQIQFKSIVIDTMNLNSVIDNNNNEYYCYKQDYLKIDTLYDTLLVYDFIIAKNWNFTQSELDTVKFVCKKSSIFGLHPGLPNSAEKMFGKSCSQRVVAIQNNSDRNINSILKFKSKSDIFFIPMEGIYDSKMDCILNHSKLQKDEVYGYFLELNSNQINQFIVKYNSNSQIGICKCPGKRDNSGYISYSFLDIKDKK